MALGANVKKFRKDAGLTQAQLAERAGMDQPALSALEKRDSKSSSFTSALAAALGKTANELLGTESKSDGEDIGPRDQNELKASDISELILCFGRADRRERELILNFARGAGGTSTDRSGATND